MIFQLETAQKKASFVTESMVENTVYVNLRARKYFAVYVLTFLCVLLPGDGVWKVPKHVAVIRHSKDIVMPDGRK